MDTKTGGFRGKLAITASLGVLFIGLCVTGIIYSSQIQGNEENARLDFARRSDRLAQETRRRVNQIVEGLRSLNGVYAASKSVERLEFRSFVASRDLSSEFPGALGFGFIERVPRSQLPAFVAKERKDNAPDFNVKTSGNAPDLFIVKYVEPLAPHKKAWGLDVGSDPIRREAIEQAIWTGQPTLTKRIQLVVRPPHEAGFLYVMPVYRNGSSTKTGPDREAALVGLICAPLDLHRLFAGVVGPEESSIDLLLYDSRTPGPQSLVYTSQASPTAEADEPPEFVREVPLWVGGQRWTLVLQPNEAYEALVDRATPLLFAVGGALLSLFTALTIWLLGTARDRAMALAERMNQDLTLASAQLSDALRESQALLDCFNSHSLVSMTDSHGLITEVNDAFCNLTGFRRDELIGQKHTVLSSDKHGPTFWSELWDIISSGQAWRGDICNRSKDGSLFWIDCIIAPVVNADGSVTKFISFGTDITPRKQTEERLRSSETFLDRAGHVAGVGGWQLEIESGKLLWSSETCRIHELPPGHEPTVDEAINYYAPEARPIIREAVERGISQGTSWDLELQLITAAGRQIWVRAIGEPEFEDGKLVRLIGAFQDITHRRDTERQRDELRSRYDHASSQICSQSGQLEELNTQLRVLETQDPLTGLANRRTFTDAVLEVAAKCKRKGNHFAVLFLDVDNFKVVNDSLGHEAGDQLLTQVVERIRSKIRNSDLLARFGGDEFAVLLKTGRSVANAEDLAERLVEAMRTPFDLVGVPVSATVSVGISLSSSGDTVEEVLRNADTAMYHAKLDGKSAWRTFEPWMLDAAQRRLELEADLRRAWEAREFFLVYQPLVDLETGLPIGLEALIRWKHPERGFVPPNVFIALAEEIRLIVPLGAWILEEACKALKGLRRKFPEFSELGVAVNVSGWQFLQGDIVADVRRALGSSGLDPSLLTLEITETVMMKDLETIIGTLADLRRLGVKIAIDDFGTGYSSMSSLAKLPVDKVKIDQSFVAVIGEDVEPTAIMRALITLCRTLGLEVVGEGIENETQLVQLQCLGCNVGQGYLFSKPLTSTDLVTWLSTCEERSAA